MAKNKVHPVDNNFKPKHKNNKFFQRKDKNVKNTSHNNSLTNNDEKRPFTSGKFARGKVEKAKEKVSVTNSKKPFNKKEWRLRQYSQKYQINQWEEKRKKVVLNQYYRELKNNENSTKGFDVQKIYAQEFDSDEERKTNPKINFVTHPNYRNKSIDVISNDDNENPVNPTPDMDRKPKKKMSALKAAQLEYERIQNSKKEKKEQYLRQKAEREEALKKYKKNKTEKYKKLSKKTRKGQPVMKDRIEMLLGEIEASMSSS